MKVIYFGQSFVTLYNFKHRASFFTDLCDTIGIQNYIWDPIILEMNSFIAGWAVFHSSQISISGYVRQKRQYQV